MLRLAIETLHAALWLLKHEGNLLALLPTAISTKNGHGTLEGSPEPQREGLHKRPVRTSSMAVKVPVAPPKCVGELVRQYACAGDLDSLSTKRSRMSSWNDSHGSCT